MLPLSGEHSEIGNLILNAIEMAIFQTEENKLELHIKDTQAKPDKAKKVLTELIDEGVKLGVSSRGVGSLRESNNGCKMVGEDFQLATAADIVADPSAPDAFVNGIMEGKEWVWDNGLLKEKEIAKYQRYMDEATRRTMEEKTLKVFEHFLSNL